MFTVAPISLEAFKKPITLFPETLEIQISRDDGIGFLSTFHRDVLVFRIRIRLRIPGSWDSEEAERVGEMCEAKRVNHGKLNQIKAQVYSKEPVVFLFSLETSPGSSSNIYPS